jgi:MSHA pilin protein MshC
MPRRFPAAQRGFTLPELVMVIAIMAILGALVGPRFMGSQAFETRGFFDEAQAVVRYAQKVAIAQRRAITVCVAANEIRAISNADCGAPVTLQHPLTAAPLVASTRGGVTLVSSAASFSFDGLGRPTPGPVSVTFNSTVAGDPARQITVATETGYVAHN